MSERKVRMSWALLIVGLVIASLNLRPALAGVSPVLDEIMGDLGLSAAGGGAITTVMVICLGVLGPLAPLLARRFGLDRTLMAGLLILAAGVVLRSAGSVPALYVGAAVSGTAIGIMNVAMPGVVKQHFPSRIGLFTSVYVSGLVLGAAAMSGLAVPLERATGYGWREVTAMAAIPAVLAAVLWLPQALRRPVARSVAPRPFRVLLRSRVTWFVTSYMGLQSLTFYIMLAWVPTIFQDAGLPADQAGYMLGLTHLAQVAATLTVPVLAGRARSQVPHVTVATLLTIAGYVGLLLAPAAAPWLWMVILGLGQGAAIALALLIITLRAPDPTSVTALSAVAQSVGYTLAALGPLLIGVLYQSSGGWTLPLLVGLGVCVLQLPAGYLAGRPMPPVEEEKAGPVGQRMDETPARHL
ncbi:CynX/NimT family MFS transporter [Streptosporangium lutulentum]|uniref:CP family cyanate transporter-like MFS transporter n=1 Tax=Streptosporangium lutulentum TaxID=1461250 RepID=A0ABT9QS84_9ACTN|nr:MFS transporter [Streptosporangium lutulentum]MDP9849610.1 CP family cyanate transporter-like MFS transporter [Streptosporangium lutulentum]